MKRITKQIINHYNLSDQYEYGTIIIDNKDAIVINAIELAEATKIRKLLPNKYKGHKIVVTFYSKKRSQ